MNGEDIPRAHGYPVRVIVPGNAGARNCKFLERITVTPNPCLNAGNWKQYAVHAPDVPLFKLAEFEEHHVELKMDPVVQDMPVQSMICTPSAWDTLKLQGSKVRSDEEQSDELTTPTQAAKTARDRTSVQGTPPP